jgi:putative heme-binding domain-containing protein
MNSIIGMLSDDQRRQFADSIAKALTPPGIMPATSRNFVKHWKIEDFTAALEAGLKQPRNLENGRTLFTATGCVACHNFHGEGGLAGPDLTSASGRYSARDLMDNILNPSKIINEQNAIQIYTMKDGKTIAGRTTNLAGDIIMVATNPMDPGGSEVRFSTKDLLSIARSPVSFMPPGLLDTLTEGDLLDLLAFLTHPDPMKPASIR